MLSKYLRSVVIQWIIHTSIHITNFNNCISVSLLEFVYFCLFLIQDKSFFELRLLISTFGILQMCQFLSWLVQFLLLSASTLWCVDSLKDKLSQSQILIKAKRKRKKRSKMNSNLVEFLPFEGACNMLQNGLAHCFLAITIIPFCPIVSYVPLVTNQDGPAAQPALLQSYNAIFFLEYIEPSLLRKNPHTDLTWVSN